MIEVKRLMQTSLHVGVGTTHRVVMEASAEEMIQYVQLDSSTVLTAWLLVQVFTVWPYILTLYVCTWVIFCRLMI